MYYFFLVLRKKERQSFSFIFWKKKKDTANSELVYSLLFGLFLSLSFATFYGSIFFTISLLLVLLLNRKYKSFFLAFGVFAVACIFTFPLLFQQLINAKVSLGSVVNWKSVLGMVSLKNILLVAIKFSVGHISFYPKWIYYGIATIVTVFVFCFVILGFLKNGRLAFLFCVPLFLGVVFSFFSPLLQYFRFLYLLPVMCLLIVTGIESYVMVKKKKGFFSIFRKEGGIKKYVNQLKEYVVFEIVFGIFLCLSLIYLCIPQFHREDWKNLSQSLQKNIPVYMIVPSSDPLLYYRPEIIPHELRSVVQQSVFDSEIYVIPYVAEIYGLDYKSELQKKGCYMKEKQLLRNLFLKNGFAAYFLNCDSKESS
jgi:hypothetical protein